MWPSALEHINAILESEPDHGRLHSRKALALGKLGRWESALSSSSRAFTLDPWDWRVWDQRGTAYAELGRWAEAKADFAKALELDRMQHTARQSLARVELYLKNITGYRQVDSELIKLHKPADDLETINDIVCTSVLSADGVVERDALMKLVAKLVSKGSESHDYLQTAGAAKYRAGEFDAAIKHLSLGIEKSQATSSPSPARTVINPSAPGGVRLVKDGREGDPFDWLFLAMAHHSMGHPDEAKTFHDKAKKWITASTKDKPVDETFGPRISWQTWLELQVLSREAEALIK